MKCHFCFVVFFAITMYYRVDGLEDGTDEERLSRKRRYLTFPEGSTFVMTMSNTKGLMWDVPTFGRPPWNSIMEFDLVFKLPNMTNLFPTHKMASRRQGILYQTQNQHWLERRELYHQIENALAAQGEDGRTCIYRALCEAKYLLKPGRSFVEDVMHTIFRLPSGSGECGVDSEEYELAGSQETCVNLSTECTYSLLNPIIS